MMRLTGMERCLQQQEKNRQHARDMDEWVEECKNGDFTNLCMLVSAVSISTILRRNGASMTDLQTWQAVAAQEEEKPKTQVVTGTSGCCGNPQNCTCDINCMCACCGCDVN